MSQYNSLNIKLSNLQLNKSKSAIKYEADVILRLSSNMISNSGEETNLSQTLLLTNRKIRNLREVFSNRTSTDIKLSKTQLPKMIQLGGLKSIIKPLGMLGFTAAA